MVSRARYSIKMMVNSTTLSLTIISLFSLAIWFSSNSRAGRGEEAKPTGAAEPGKATHTHARPRFPQVPAGLYSKAAEVEERGPEFVAQSVKEGRPLVVVYYASWCPHCKSYAPTFIKYAKQYSKFYGALFAAVDCAAFETQCDAMKIKTYPTVRAFNFVRDGKSLIGSQGSQVDSTRVKAYLQTHGVSVAVQESSSVADLSESQQTATEKSSDKKRLSEWVKLSTLARARSASPEERLGDALASLQYLLLSETPRLVVGKSKDHQERMDALLLLLQVVSAALPSQQSAEPVALPDVRRATHWVEEHRKDYSLDEKSWRIGMSQALYGVGPSTPTTAKVRKDASTSSRTAVWRVCGMTEGRASHSNTTLPDKGYTCGLWMLMHFLTVATNSRSLLPAKVETAIHGLVAQLFTCSLCRLHFLETFDSCTFGRCSGDESEEREMAAARLQLWLFRVHNSVTARIFKEHGALVSGGADQFRSVLWPDASVKLGVVGKNIAEPHFVLAHLRRSYWNEERWGTLDYLPTQNALDRLIN